MDLTGRLAAPGPSVRWRFERLHGVHCRRAPPTGSGRRRWAGSDRDRSTERARSSISPTPPVRPIPPQEVPSHAPLEENAPEAVLAAAKDMLAKGLVEGTAGNISARQEDGTVCVTPSSVDYGEMQLEDLMVVDLDGKVVSGSRSPSSELPLHLAAYRAFDDVGSVIHSHPVHATMFAVARQPIPSCIDEFTIYVGGDVRVTEYAMSGNEDVGRSRSTRSRVVAPP